MDASGRPGSSQDAAGGSGSDQQPQPQQQQQQQQQQQPGQQGLPMVNGVSQQQQLNMAMQNPVQMMQVIQAQISNLQRQWATVQSQPESTQKMEAAQHLAVQMKRMKFLQAQTTQALQNRQQQSSPQQAATQSPQGGSQGQQTASLQQGSSSSQPQPTEGQAPGSSSQGPNGTTLEASNPAHNAQLAALQAFAQQQRMQALQQQRGSFDGQSWQPGAQSQPSTTTNGSIEPQSSQSGQQLQSNSQLGPVPQQAQQAAQGSAKGDLVGAVRAFMAARGTPLPANMATSFFGPSGTAIAETKAIEMQNLFATVVQFGGSARVGAQPNGWAIVASKLGLAVAPIPQNHVAGQNEVDGNGIPLPAFVAPRLCQFFKDRFAAFEEFWLSKMKGAGGQAAAAAYVATNGATGQQQPQQQQPQSTQQGDGQQVQPLEMQGQTPSIQQGGAMQNGSMQPSAQAGPSNLSQQMMPQPNPLQMAGQPLLSGAASVQEAALKANQLQAQLPRQMQQLQELINGGKMTQQQARDRYMYLQNAAKMAMLQAQALAQAHAAAQAANPQSQQSQGMMMPGQLSSFAGTSLLPSTDAGQMRPPPQQQQQQQPTPTMEAKKVPKRNRKATGGASKASNTPFNNDTAATSSLQASPSQLTLQAQQAMRMLQQGNLNPTLQVGAFATIRTAQLASQGITGVDVSSVSQAMAQIYSSFLTQAQNAGQPMHVAAPLAFTAAQQDAHKQQLQNQPSQGQNSMASTILQQQQQQQEQQQPPRHSSPYPPRSSSQQAQSRPSSQAGPASQLQIPVQAPTKPGKFKVEYLPIRRDVHSHGGWDMDVVERQMGDYLDGKGRLPRSVRELGHVDVESLIMSLRSRLEIEVTYSLNALFILTAGVQAPGFHLLLSLCEDLCDELLDILEEAAFGKLYQEEDEISDEEENKQAKTSGVVSEDGLSLSYAEWVTGILDEEDTLQVCEKRGRKKVKRMTSEDGQMDETGSDGLFHGMLEEGNGHEGKYTDRREGRHSLRCAQVAISILDIFRNLATIEDNHLFLNNEPRFMRLLMEIILSVEEEQRQRLKDRKGDADDKSVAFADAPQSKGRATVFSSLEGLRMRKDVLCIIACLSGETCNLTRLDSKTVTAMFDLIFSLVKDASDIEQEHGIMYGEVPVDGNSSGTKLQPMLRKVPQHADMALEAFSSMAQPDVNRQLLGKIIDEAKLVSLGATLIKLLPISDVDFQMLKTEARLGYCERIAMSLFNIAYLGSPQVKKQLKEAVGAVGIIFRCIKRLIRVNAFSRNPFAVITRRLIETLRMLDGGDNFNRPPLLGFGMQGSQGRDTRGQGQERSSRGGLLMQDEISVVELMTVEGIDPVMVAELEQLL